MRGIDTEQPGKAVDEGLGVGEFAAAGAAPFADKRVNVGGVGHRRWQSTGADDWQR
jgi:hypothetical protein